MASIVELGGRSIRWTERELRAADRSHLGTFARKLRELPQNLMRQGGPKFGIRSDYQLDQETQVRRQGILDTR